MDTSNSYIYHLDFRVKKGMILQNEMRNGDWTNESVRTNLPNLNSVNVVIVVVTPGKYYDVIINEKSLQTQYPVDLDRLKLFHRLSINGNTNSCFSIDQDNSFMVTFGEF